MSKQYSTIYYLCSLILLVAVIQISRVHRGQINILAVDTFMRSLTSHVCCRRILHPTVNPILIITKTCPARLNVFPISRRDHIALFPIDLQKTIAFTQTTGLTIWGKLSPRTGLRHPSSSNHCHDWLRHKSKNKNKLKNCQLTDSFCCCAQLNGSTFVIDNSN